MNLKEYLYIFDDVVHFSFDRFWYYHTPDQDVLLDVLAKKRLIINFNRDRSLIHILHLNEKKIHSLFYKDKCVYYEQPVNKNIFRWFIYMYQAIDHQHFTTLRIDYMRCFEMEPFTYVTAKGYQSTRSNEFTWKHYNSLQEMLTNTPGFEILTHHEPKGLPAHTGR